MTHRTLFAALLGAAAFAGAAQAQTAAVLVGDAKIALVDVAAKKVSKTMDVTGAGSIVGIDVRPADGMLYAVSADGTVSTIDPTSGKATKKSMLETMVPKGSRVTVDFNPVADRLRVIGADGTNLRANVDDGKVVKDGALKFAESDMHKGEKPNVVAGAYVNSVKGAKETTLYDIDATIGGLLKQAPPNDGVLGAVGKLGVMSDAYAFDISPEAGGGNKGWLMVGDTLYGVDLASGKATSMGKIAGLSAPARDIAIMPAM
jgi:DNA-binding beta-propeller fold protein YncE